jgi:hypothetical protein
MPFFTRADFFAKTGQISIHGAKISVKCFKAAALFWAAVFFVSLTKIKAMNPNLYAMAQPVINRAYLTEIDFITAPNRGDQIKFQDYPELVPRDGKSVVYMTGVIAHYSAQVTTSPNGFTVLSAANLAALDLTIQVESTQNVYKFPLISLVDNLNGGFIRQLDNLPVNLTKSFVTVNTNGVIAANTAVCFTWIYRRLSRIK